MFLRIVVVGAAVVAAAGWFVTAPESLPDGFLDGVAGDAARGATVFAAAGCASCHAAEGAAPAELPVLSGGQRFATAFGTFVAPNISSDPVAGIGGWTDAQIVTATLRGVSPEGTHYYPAFPFAAYRNMTAQDAADLVAYLRSLPADATPSAAHDLAFPFNIRRAVGVWKMLYVQDGWTLAQAPTAQIERGRYLVEALGHCAECHTPRNLLGGLDRARWLGGGPNPDGEGSIPNITPGALMWSEGEIAYYLASGFTPAFDSAGGSMAHVVANTARLTDADRAAIAAYLKAVPPVAPVAE